MPLSLHGEGKKSKRGDHELLEKETVAGEMIGAKTGAQAPESVEASQKEEKVEPKAATGNAEATQSVLDSSTSSPPADANHSPKLPPSGKQVEKSHPQPSATKTTKSSPSSSPPEESSPQTAQPPSCAEGTTASADEQKAENGTAKKLAPPKRKAVSSAPAPSKRRRRLAVPDAPVLQPNRSGRGAQHGNYRGYYHRRLGRGDARSDARLPLLERAWVPADGRVLDVGCNDGALTLEVARRYAPASVLGVDVDAALVARARQRATDDASRLADAGRKTAAPAAAAVGFAVCDAGAAGETPAAFAQGRYDVVLALSVSKWIHLHAGDEGLRRFFGRVLGALKPGGVFVLEAQGSASYKKARRRGAVPKERVMSTFKLKPEQFPQFLVGKAGGFERYVTLREVQGKNTPFGKRPIFAFFKRAGDEGDGKDDKGAQKQNETEQNESDAEAKDEKKKEEGAPEQSRVKEDGSAESGGAEEKA